MRSCSGGAGRVWSPGLQLQKPSPRPRPSARGREGRPDPGPQRTYRSLNIRDMTDSLPGTKGLDTEGEGRQFSRQEPTSQGERLTRDHAFAQHTRANHRPVLPEPSVLTGEDFILPSWLSALWSPGLCGPPSGQATLSLTVSAAAIPGHPQPVSRPDARARAVEVWLSQRTRTCLPFASNL